MFKSLRLKFRRLTFGFESIYQTQKLIKKPRPINVVRACKLKKIQLAEDIISEEFKPLHVKLNLKQVSKDIDLVIGVGKSSATGLLMNSPLLDRKTQTNATVVLNQRFGKN